MALNKDELQAKAKLREEEVQTEFGPLLLRQLSGADRDNYESLILTKKGKDLDVNVKLVRIVLVQLSLIDPETGKRMYGDDQRDALNTLPATVIAQLFDAAQELNRYTKQDIEELAKNSEGDPSEDSSTASLAISA